MYSTFVSYVNSYLARSKNERAPVEDIKRGATRLNISIPNNLILFLDQHGYRITKVFEVYWITRISFIPAEVSYYSREHNDTITNWYPLNISTGLNPSWVENDLFYPEENLCQARCNELHDKWYTNELIGLQEKDESGINRVLILLSFLSIDELIDQIDLSKFQIYNAEEIKSEELQIKKLRLKLELLKLALYS